MSKGRMTVKIATGIFLALFLFSGGSVPAQTQGGAANPAGDDFMVPSLSEFENIGPGILFMKNSSELENNPSKNDNPEAKKAPAPRTFRQIMETYHKGDYDTTFRYLLPLARKGSPDAQEVLGLMYRIGQGVPKNNEYALDWLLMAAEQGRPLAQHHLASMYFNGEGTVKDPIKALVWIKLALIYYKDGMEKNRALQDRKNIEMHLSRRDRERSDFIAKEWLEKRGEGHLLSLDR